MKGLQSTKKQLKVIEYFNENLLPNGVLVLQETHLTLNNEVRWRDEFNTELSFSHSASNSCKVLIAFLGTNKVTVKKKTIDAEGRFLILDVEIDGENFVFINLCNANTESKQIKIFEKLFSYIKLLNLDERSQIVFSGDFNRFQFSV